jgi:hypothetical protein
MSEWREAGVKLGQILADRFHEIRRDIPSEEITTAAMQSIALSGFNFTMSTEDGPVEIDVNLIKAVIDKINDSHKKGIMELIGSIGELIKEVPLKENAKADVEGRYAGEDETHIFLCLDGMLMKINKEMATKILTLGVVP